MYINWASHGGTCSFRSQPHLCIKFQAIQDFIVSPCILVGLVGLVVYNLMKASVIWEEEPPLRKGLQEMTCRQVYRGIFLINYWRGRTQSRCHPWVGDPGLYKKTDWASLGKQAFHHNLCFSFCNQVPTLSLTWLPSKLVICEENKPFPPQLAFDQCFITAREGAN